MDFMAMGIGLMQVNIAKQLDALEVHLLIFTIFHFLSNFPGFLPFLFLSFPYHLNLLV